MRTGKSHLRFSIRELALVVVIVGLALAWAIDRQRMQRSLRFTGQALDVAIEGNGFLCLMDQKTSSTVYTRRGAFSTNENDQLVMRLHGIEYLANPPIQIPPNAIAIAITPGGLVLTQLPYIDTKSSSDRRTWTANIVAFGQLQLASFSQKAGLKQVAPGIFSDTNESGPPDIFNPGTGGVGVVCQGMQERRPDQKLSLNPWRW